jgi:toxin-antitoxin system PIN domain toxin
LIDANLLLYAVNRDLPKHKPALSWFEKILSSDNPVGLPWVVILAFLRIATNGRVFTRPLSSDVAIGLVADWLDQPNVKAISPGDRHWSILQTLLEQTGMAGNLTTDAHIAALALEQGYTVYSADNDFKRFPGLRHINPLVTLSNKS